MEKAMYSKEKVRIIVHLDVDAFYVAAERELRKDWKGRPLAVSQYNPYGSLDEVGINDPARILYDGEKGNIRVQQQGRNVNGSLIAVSYEARAKNIQRNDRGLVAIQKCPNDLVIVQVPVSNGKANLTMYRDASQRLFSRLLAHMHQAVEELSVDIIGGRNGTETNNIHISVEKASIDEVYFDLSKPIEQLCECLCKNEENWILLMDRLMRNNGELKAKTTIGGLESEKDMATNRLSKNEIRKGSHLQTLDSSSSSSADVAEQLWWRRGEGYSINDSGWTVQELSLAVGAWITLQARQALTDEFDGVYTLAAGISTNKTMAKLASGLKKPNRQTLVNPADKHTLQKLFHPLPIGRLRGLGGKFGDQVSKILGVQTVGELAQIPLRTMQQTFDEDKALWLSEMAQGHCCDPVKDRTKSKRIGAGKTFQGHLSIRGYDSLRKWIGNLALEVFGRVVAEETRYPKTLTCWLHLQNVSDERENEKGGRNTNDGHAASLSTSIPQNITQSQCTNLALKLANQIIDRVTNKKNEAFSIIGMEVSASNFVEKDETQGTILNAFRKQMSRQSTDFLVLDKTHEPLKKKPATGTSSYLSSVTTKAQCSVACTDTGSQKKIPEVSTVHRAKRSHSAVMASTTVIGAPVDKIDVDMKYAQRLQELFDKEHQALQSIPKTKRRKMESQQLISSFLTKSSG
ncbi:DNA-directed DNA polymerase [Nitzschia inconspicua]|uniref:DNA polymerase eta n=1 Tax=Nitzschia inconspicua TaxID=303405 RepID=A0A9K3KUV2_9STRA|nr:DNA-directed DNA polymerase [Nitzschia inconspicua]